MFEIIARSGLLGYIIVLIGIALVIFIVKAFTAPSTTKVEQIAITRNALLFWGILAVALGFLGHTLGIFGALTIMAEGTQELKGSDVAEVMKISLSPIILGFVVLAIAGLGWFVLGRTSKMAA